MIEKNKTIFLAGLITATILSFSTINFAMAEQVVLSGEDPTTIHDIEFISDFELLSEAEEIEKTSRDLEYDYDGNNISGTNNKDEQRHQEIVKELNLRGVFHESNN